MSSSKLCLLTAFGISLLLCASSAGQQAPNGPSRPRRVDNKPLSTGDGIAASKATASAAGQPVDDGDIVRVDTQLVTVPTVVMDQTGRPVTNLRADNFVLFEDGKLQPLANFATAEAPFEVALLLDTSGSTREDIELIRSSADAFIAALRPGDRVAILAFAGGKNGAVSPAEVQIACRLTSDREQLKRAVESIGTSNGTPLFDALVSVAADVFAKPPDQLQRGRRALVALTDGVDSASSAEFDDVAVKLAGSGVASYFVQVNTEDYVEDRLLRSCEESGALRLSHAQLLRYRKAFMPRDKDDVLQDFCAMGSFERMQISRNLYKLAARQMDQLAKSSGGKTFQASSLRDARAAFAEVAKEIGTQYSLGYYSTNTTKDGAFRKIRVELRGANKGLSVRARDGYAAPGS